jgi:hypothetical protein
MKKSASLLIIMILLAIVSCNSLSSNELVGKKFYIDEFHTVEFKSSSTYWIQQSMGCGGEGSWSISNEKVILGPNNSGCETTREKQGKYSLSDFK